MPVAAEWELRELFVVVVLLLLLKDPPPPLVGVAVPFSLEWTCRNHLLQAKQASLLSCCLVRAQSLLKRRLSTFRFEFVQHLLTRSLFHKRLPPLLACWD